VIESTDRGAIRTVTLDRPERRNALDPDGLDALRDAVTEAETPVAYLRGAGEAFCAGADLDVVDGLDRDAAAAFARRGQRTAAAMADADSVVVAGALACDVRAATPNATFAEPGVTFGLFGAWGGTVRLPAVVGTSTAMDLALSGRVIDAEEALRTGLASRVAENPRDLAEEIAGNDPAALSVLKECLRDESDRETREKREATAFDELVAERNSRKG
jgi:enoyl-CoA hydratase/carnithine racemase